ncbi:OmpA family protein [Flavobacterium sp. LHD-80]|uniref:OmpA family protein n=1 Tax=Flavobacterium sp. LHD-80 TaxID=3071411 RepID=UPI0027DFCEFB|nr:OmpA family protein [Flavobacterium sp. LHD-80]MDQ6471705.1 OmpA family protein [Flavobacterium sp. LHD-80]
MCKKIKNAFVLLIICIMNIGTIQAQDKKLDKANEAYGKFAFVEAAKLYEELITKGNNSIEAYTKLGDCYYYNGKYPEAVKCYSRMISSSNVDAEYFFRYAQALNNSQQYKESEEIMKKYYAKSGKKDLSENWNEAKLMADIQKQSGRYTIKSLEINTPFSDFGTAFYDKNKIVYASAKDTGIIIKRKHSWNEKSFLKLYSADVTVDGGLQNPVLLKGDVNTRYHQSTPAITKDGKVMFFTRNNYAEGKLGTDKDGITFLKIYRAENIDGEWKNVKELISPINGDGFSSAHPALNANETELYFASDRNNKFGNSDLYVVSLKPGGIVGNDVKKLGDEINTLGRETYPYVDASGILYFSSDGHPGLGGLDVYAALKDENGLYHVINLGDGVNTASDDFAYGIQDDTKKGYFSSNRNGNDDIYGFIENRPLDFGVKPLIYGTLRDFTTGTPIEGIAIGVYNSANEKVATGYSDKDGKYLINLEPFKDYKLTYIKPGLTEIIQKTLPLKQAEKREYSFNFFKEVEVIVDQEKVVIQDGDDLTKKLKLGPIYFDFNGYKIRESSKSELNKVLEVMKAYPQISVKVNSHTDSRGKDDFNMKLSENRAKSTVAYLVEHGISAERLKGEGFGETRLINKCSNGVKCSEKEHELNRRSEFIVTLTKQ